MSERGDTAVLQPGSEDDRSALRRLIGISSSLVGTQAATSILGLLFWGIAARQFTVGAVGVAGAAVSLMTLLGTVGTVGLGTLLISRLPHLPQADRWVVVRTALLVSAVITTVICLLVPVVAIYVLGADNLKPVAGDLSNALLFAAGTALMAVTIILDQAVLTIGNGTLQLERNVIASATKVVALVVLALGGAHGGMTVFAAWTIGSLVSLPIAAWRSRSDRVPGEHRKLVDFSTLRGLGRAAAGHHALNITLMIPLLLLPVIVTVALSTRDNGIFTGSLQVTGFVFALPYAVSVALFAAAQGNVRQVIDRMRLTIPFGLGVSLLANAALFPLAPYVLQVFGDAYANDGAVILRVLVLAGLPFVIKDHFVALRRVQERTGQATVVLAVSTVAELVAAYVGAQTHGVLGLSVAWVAVLYVEALVLAVPLLLIARSGPVLDEEDDEADDFDLVMLPPPLLPLHYVPRYSPADGIPLPQRPIDPDLILRARTAPTGPMMLPPPPASLSATLGGLLTGPINLPLRIENPSPYPSRRMLREAGSSAGSTGPRHPRRAAAPDPGYGPATGAIPTLDPTAGSPPPSRDWLVGPALLVTALGVLGIGLAVVFARGGEAVGPWPQVFYVGGLALMFLPAAIGVLLPGISRGPRILLAVAMPVALQLSRLALYPTRFMFHDELLHQNVLRLIQSTGELFGVNPLLPITTYYPGLEVATDAVADLTGLAPHAAAAVVLIASRLVLSLAVILVIQQVSGSTRMGAAGAVVYATNPQMLFFNSQFSYQSIALPLAVLTVYLFLSRRRGEATSLVAPLIGAAGVVFSHHVTAGLMVLAFVLWWMLDLVIRRGRGSEAGSLAIMAGASVGFLGLSIANPGNTLGSYLGAIAVSSGDAVEALAEGGSTKQAFQNSAGVGPEPWEQLLIIVSLLLTLAALLPALWYARAWARARITAAVLFVLTAMLYPLIPGGHLTVATAEVGDRSAGFVFLGVGFAVGCWLWRRPPSKRFSLLFGAGATVAFLGGVVLGAGPTSQQLPGQFQVSADARSIDGPSLGAADWMAANLPTGSVVYADRVDGLLAAAVGGQFTVRHISTDIDASRLLLDPEYTDKDVALIRQAHIRYVIADRRDSFGLPNQQVYIESGEFGGDGRTVPVPLAALQKFDNVAGVDRIYDNGSVAIYDVGALDAP